MQSSKYRVSVTPHIFHDINFAADWPIQCGIIREHPNSRPQPSAAWQFCPEFEPAVCPAFCWGQFCRCIVLISVAFLQRFDYKTSILYIRVAGRIRIILLFVVSEASTANGITPLGGIYAATIKFIVPNAAPKTFIECFVFSAEFSSRCSIGTRSKCRQKASDCKSTNDSVIFACHVVPPCCNVMWGVYVLGFP